MKHLSRDWTKGVNKKRNATVCKLAEDQHLSYSIIAEMLGMTREAVAGVVFRNRHPREKLISCAGKPNSPNKTGQGYRRQSYYPEKTVANTR